MVLVWAPKWAHDIAMHSRQLRHRESASEVALPSCNPNRPHSFRLLIHIVRDINAFFAFVDNEYSSASYLFHPSLINFVKSLRESTEEQSRQSFAVGSNEVV